MDYGNKSPEQIVGIKIEHREDYEKMKETVVKSLLEAFNVHELLGEKGQELMQKNQFGETALRMDIEAEGAILDFLRKQKIPIRVISEEHGITEIGDNPQYLGVLDGLDGSGVYKKARGKGRYGTMFGIFKSLDPTYDDYIASGIMEHSTGRLFIASKNSGAFIVRNNETLPIHAEQKTELDKNMKIYIDENFGINRETFSENLKGFNTQCLQASSADYMGVVEGEAGFALECSFKGNLEKAVAYGLVREAGGVMVDMDGNDIGDKKYLEFAQQGHIPIVTAGNLKLAQALLEHIKSIRELRKSLAVSPENLFEKQKRKYFSQLAVQVRYALKFHKAAGLLLRKEGKRDWGNVSEHCLVEAARVNIFAEKLQLAEEIKRDLILAAALHDFFKKAEKEMAVAGKLDWELYERSGEAQTKYLVEAKVKPEIISLVNSVAHSSLVDIERLLAKEKLTEEEIAVLVMHYVDDYTINAEWAKPAEERQPGQEKNDLDRRLDKAEENPRYDKINKAGLGRFRENETAYQAQRRIGHDTEEKLARLIEEKIGDRPNPKDLPVIIDQQIKDEIAKIEIKYSI